MHYVYVHMCVCVHVACTCMYVHVRICMCLRVCMHLGIGWECITQTAGTVTLRLRDSTKLYKGNTGTSKFGNR